MLIVDAGVHVWPPNSPERPWSTAAGFTAQGSDFGWQELLRRMADTGVDRAVLLPPTWVGDDNSFALEAARARPDTFAVMGRMAPDAPESIERLRAWRRQEGMLGVRIVLRPGLPWLQDDSADAFWSVAAASAVPLMFVPLGHWAFVERVVERNPALRVAIDHLGGGIDGVDEVAFAHLPALLRLARFSNVAVKASAMPCYSSQPYPFRNLHGTLRQAFEAFGPRRTFWGSDLTRLPCTYREAVTMFLQELPWLQGADLELVMGRGICDWLGWDVAPGHSATATCPAPAPPCRPGPSERT